MMTSEEERNEIRQRSYMSRLIQRDQHMWNCFFGIFCGLPQSCICIVCLSPKSLPQLRYRPLTVFAILMWYAA